MPVSELLRQSFHRGPRAFWIKMALSCLGYWIHRRWYWDGIHNVQVICDESSLRAVSSFVILYQCLENPYVLFPRYHCLFALHASQGLGVRWSTCGRGTDMKMHPRTVFLLSKIKDASSHKPYLTAVAAQGSYRGKNPFQYVTTNL